MQGWFGVRRRLLLLAFGVVVVAAALGGFALYEGGDPPTEPHFAIVHTPRGLLYKATTARFEAELQQAEAASRATAAAAFASAKEQARAYRYRAAEKELRWSLEAYETLSAHLNAGLVALNLGELAAAEAHFRIGLERIEERGGPRLRDGLSTGPGRCVSGAGPRRRGAGRTPRSPGCCQARAGSSGRGRRPRAHRQSACDAGQNGRGPCRAQAGAGNLQATGSPGRTGGRLGESGSRACRAGAPEAALDWHRQAYQLAEQRLGSIGQAFALTDIGNVYRMRGQISDALVSLGRALRFHAELGNTGDRAAVTDDIGDVYFRQGQLDRALAAYEGSFKLYTGIKHAVGQAAALSHVGNVYERQRQLDKALAVHEKALELNTGSGTRRGAGAGSRQHRQRLRPARPDGGSAGSAANGGGDLPTGKAARPGRAGRGADDQAVGVAAGFVADRLKTILPPGHRVFLQDRRLPLGRIGRRC